MHDNLLTADSRILCSLAFQSTSCIDAPTGRRPPAYRFGRPKPVASKQGLWGRTNALPRAKRLSYADLVVAMAAAVPRSTYVRLWPRSAAGAVVVWIVQTSCAHACRRQSVTRCPLPINFSATESPCRALPRTAEPCVRRATAAQEAPPC